MASVKSEKRFDFPHGNIWVLMDDEWGVEITGENGKGGDLQGMGSWEFTSREAWLSWGETCATQLQNIYLRSANGEISEETVGKEIGDMDHLMPNDIKKHLIDG